MSWRCCERLFGTGAPGAQPTLTAAHHFQSRRMTPMRGDLPGKRPEPGTGIPPAPDRRRRCPRRVRCPEKAPAVVVGQVPRAGNAPRRKKERPADLVQGACRHGGCCVNSCRDPIIWWQHGHQELLIHYRLTTHKVFLFFVSVPTQQGQTKPPGCATSRASRLRLEQYVAFQAVRCQTRRNLCVTFLLYSAEWMWYFTGG